uniref:BPI-like protein n=1 Tax=Trepomonas sp. PC1 TaxID=1076344 RepID=A0A146KAS6_9EUKA|eukprot:JAP93930.1 BPI-like protein [Trepomonas sp. PC1]
MTPDYPRILKGKDSAAHFLITQPAATKYIECGIQSALVFAQHMTIPDLDFNLNLGVTSIRFSLKDIKFSDLSARKANLELNGDESVVADLEGANVILSLQWAFSQTSYPYLTDGGAGKILLNNASLRAQVKSGADYEECPGHYNTSIESAQVDFDSLKVELTGGSSWLYQSLINIILDAIQSSLIDLISDVLVDSIGLLLTSEAMSNGLYDYYLKPVNDIIKDERLVTAWTVGQGWLSIAFSGYIYNFNHLEDEFIKPEMLKPIIYNYANDETSYQFAQPVFDNMFYIFHKYHDLFSSQNFKLTKAPTLQIMNAAVLVTVEGEAKDGSAVKLLLKGDPDWRTDIRVNGTKKTNTSTFSFQFEKYSVETQYTGDIEALVKEVIEHINEVMRTSCGYQLNVTPFLDLDLFHVIFDPKNNVIRFMGDLPDECAPL